MKRKQQRDLLVKSVFAHFFQKDLSLTELLDSIEFNFMNERLKNEDHRKYVDPLLEHLSKEESECQKLISDHLKTTWKIERIPWLDLAVLEVAIVEIKYLDDIPFDVTVNEAVDLAKLYSTEKSPSFINGILVSIFEEISRSVE
ncbi:transcription antitermination factor NusB [Xylocopilactobacillus apis]|uniref:Transcription antitermination protein NusB n=1 Tax=Xylocopilactobacillus apis TaxID=2932183 RepID=A0AAU9DR24_9LACO|nr:transcription antitermination factor NusB [Xylocopilactobacillus apis]BDR56073.1 N utilization substance protein B [Xylocopilactobacillus apis]